MYSSNASESDDEDNANRLRPAESLPETSLINRQRRVRANWGELEAFLGELCSRLARSSFTVCVTSDRTMRSYNKRFRQQDKTTDVLSFPAGSNGTGEKHYLGDILISAETARQNAARYGLCFEEEFKILALHGVLHLLGYDHEADAGQMARAEKLWSAKLGLRASLTGRSRKPLGKGSVQAEQRQ